jgi:hypothetical protein
MEWGCDRVDSSERILSIAAMNGEMALCSQCNSIMSDARAKVPYIVIFIAGTWRCLLQLRIKRRVWLVGNK